MKILGHLSNKERRQLGIKEKTAVVYQWKKGRIIAVGDKPLYIILEDKVIPTLRNEKWQELPKIWIDRGAVKFILNGADVLRPGIVKMEDFKRGEAVAIMFENSAVGIGIALMDKEEAEKAEKGKVIKTVHVKGDEIWKFSDA